MQRIHPTPHTGSGFSGLHKWNRNEVKLTVFTDHHTIDHHAVNAA